MQAPLWQFWTDWAIKALGTVATLLVAFIALFGAWLRNRIWPPGLTISLVCNEGYPSTVVATDLYIFLLSVEVENAAGDFEPIWVGRAPLGWRHESNPQPKKIGHSWECDLCHILKDPLEVRFSPLIPGQAPDRYIEKFRIAVTLQARGVEKDSNILRIKISWDGKWSDDKTEMKRHHLVLGAA